MTDKCTCGVISTFDSGKQRTQQMTQSRTLSQTQSAPTLMTQLRAPRPHLHALRQWGTFPSSDRTRETYHLRTWWPSSLCPAQRSPASPAPRQPRGRRSGFFSPANTLTAGVTRETSPAEVTPQRLAYTLIVVAGNQHLHTLSACPPTERMMMPGMKVILISLATLVALALATAAAVKLLSGTNSEEVEVVELGADLHKGRELFDFSDFSGHQSQYYSIHTYLYIICFFCFTHQPPNLPLRNICEISSSFIQL